MWVLSYDQEASRCITAHNCFEITNQWVEFLPQSCWGLPPRSSSRCPPSPPPSGKHTISMKIKVTVKEEEDDKQRALSVVFGIQWWYLTPSIRKDINEKKPFSFGHCPNHLNLLIVKSSIHWHFWRNGLFLLTKNALLKRGPKNSGMGRPPPHNSGNVRKKTFFFNWPLPLLV